MFGDDLQEPLAVEERGWGQQVAIRVGKLKGCANSLEIKDYRGSGENALGISRNSDDESKVLVTALVEQYPTQYLIDKVALQLMSFALPK
jgi:hypothetical protein